VCRGVEGESDRDHRIVHEFKDSLPEALAAKLKRIGLFGSSVVALEYATGRQARIIGKPLPDFSVGGGRPGDAASPGGHDR